MSTESLLKKFNMLSVNQLNAKAKLLEVWKALNLHNYPLTIKQQWTDHIGVSTRADTKKRHCEIGKTTLTKKTCISDAIKNWNLAPEKIKQCNTAYQAKKQIRIFVCALPI